MHTFRGKQEGQAVAMQQANNHQFAEQGYLYPRQVLALEECRQFLQTVRDTRQRQPEWEKGNAVSSRTFYQLAAHKSIIDVVAELIGEDVMLWGATLRERGPGVRHPWHSDIESWSVSPGKMVTVWLGLENTTKGSSLTIISRSHLFGATVQERRHTCQRERDQLTDEEILHWATEHDDRSELLNFEMRDGQALFYDGRLWHGSRNVTEANRWAALLHYATPDTAIRVPDPDNLNWPLRPFDHKRPPCLIVRGTDWAGVNRMVSPPLLPPRDAASLTNYVVPLRLPLKPDPESGWKPYHCFKGSSEVFDNFSCHVSALSQDKCPHPPHTHQEEELLIVLDGEVDLLLPDLSHDDDQQTIRLKRGELVYYPINFAHTLKTVSTEPANYLMLRWCCDAEPIDDAVELPFGRFDLPESFDNLDAQQGFRTHLIFEGPTAHLGKLHCHISTLGPGASYEPHIDPYDVAIIVLEGELETLGQTLMSCGVIYYPAGEPHGMSNPGQEMAKYVVFEFHGRLKTAPDEYEHLHREFHQLLDNYTHLQEHYQRLEVDYQNLRQACSLGKLARLTRWLRRVFSPAQSAQ